MQVNFVILGLIVCLCEMPAPAQAQPKGGVELSPAKQAMLECARNYCGPRSGSVQGARGIWVENCFQQKMGKSPAQMGVSIPRMNTCRGLAKRVRGG